MANYDALINLKLKGFDELKKVEKTLNNITNPKSTRRSASQKLDQSELSFLRTKNTALTLANRAHRIQNKLKGSGRNLEKKIVDLERIGNVKQVQNLSQLKKQIELRKKDVLEAEKLLAVKASAPSVAKKELSVEQNKLKTLTEVIRLKKLELAFSRQAGRTAQFIEKGRTDPKILPNTSMLGQRIARTGQAGGVRRIETSQQKQARFDKVIIKNRKRNEEVSKQLIGSEKIRNAQLIKTNDFVKKASSNLIKLGDSFGKLSISISKLQNNQIKGVGPNNLLGLPSSKDLEGRAIQRLGQRGFIRGSQSTSKITDFTASSVEKAEFFEKRRNAAIARGIANNNKLIGSERIRNSQLIKTNDFIKKQNIVTRKQANNLIKLSDSFGKLGAGVSKFQEGLVPKTRTSSGKMLALPSAEMLDQRVRGSGQVGGFSRRIPRFRFPRPTKGFDIESALISGAFPLLFGQGPIGAAAGALGGGIGGMFGQMGGFAGGIAATAVVQQIQALANSARQLGEAVRTTSGTFDLMTQRSLFSSEAVEAQARSLEKQGKQTELASLLTEELNKVLGVGSVSKLKELGLRSREMNREFGILSTQLQLFIAGPLTAFLKEMNKVLSRSNIIGVIDSDLKRVRKELGPEEADKRLQEISQFMTPREKFLGNPLFPRIGGLSLAPGFKSGAVGGIGFADSIRKGINVGGVFDPKRLLEISQIASRGLSSEQIGGSPLDGFNNIRPTNLSKLDDLQAETKLLERSLQIGSKVALQEKEAKEILAEQNKLKGQNLKLADTDFLKQIQKRDALTEQLNLQQQIKDLLSTGMTDAVMGLIDGTKTLSESLSGIARQLASLFLNRAFSAMFGGIFQAEGGYNRAGSFKAFQYGGVVSSPTLGMIGEGGEPEYVIPSSKMDGAMARYSAGARGGAVIPGGSGASGTVAGSSGSTIVEYTGPVLNFNGDEYVPKDSVPQIINAAAKQGATLGQSRTLNTLKNSRSSRAKIGI